MKVKVKMKKKDQGAIGLLFYQAIYLDDCLTRCSVSPCLPNASWTENTERKRRVAHIQRSAFRWVQVLIGFCAV